MNPGASLTLDSLTLTQGSSFASGGAILNQGNLTVTRSTFSNKRTVRISSGRLCRVVTT